MLSERPESQSPDWGDATDEALFVALQQGDKSALAILYDRYSRLVYTVAFRILNNGPEAEDLTQEIFLNLWQKQTYNPTRSALSRFLSTVTRNRAIDRVRSRSIRRRILKGMVPQQSQPVASFSLPVEQASLGERSQRVRAALKNLPEKQRELLWLAYYHGFSQSEIANHTNIPLGTVKSRMRQGLLKLKGTLQDLVD
ncbi:sigma-70 family RNA polymerase sigma factor [Leptolyngbyaceae cyanobacterium CCMR0082]|uniref:Sigma-70 family RNA polymerase sigma factor n=2 Tax=Adonisia turfae TaxID=2950184 RepID=A0A6M0S1W2_9CYAN|nr:sigma-70 family RNA polymerase sigma factor [Adonisia turfae]MDV3349705.1 sigma-70 family RNA polymerase sigma factor [Leptothoe sp. LEGE 181152]NEZ56547.1 sigma-70 family RNA polymerase sigma factor [Adonisia turfae CCMR0081]NEZ62459.1 sigma-70 family RNA polymerase sigma factor [Adonisia turfae CCMR0082]